ncbi:hypothetical protein Cylst_2437 [Cylindrospermum stagnale PCC 7417]|uniref:Uncharacterized protein n=1 Tax=Cylindrospermum stagnale PCC 7417 TaxID=56107 RepID=K9WWA3_9NOST|nr:hypothetical protein Cylst_2437 [Cylindrospermum stagnale PCC 7417]
MTLGRKNLSLGNEAKLVIQTYSGMYEFMVSPLVVSNHGTSQKLLTETYPLLTSDSSLFCTGIIDNKAI